LDSLDLIFLKIFTKIYIVASSEQNNQTKKVIIMAKVKQSAPITPPAGAPKKKIFSGTGLPMLVGLLTTLAGLYLILRRFTSFTLGFDIPYIAVDITLFVAGFLLLREAMKRSTFRTLKRHYDKYI